MFVSKASRYAFRISHNVYFDNQLKTGKDRVGVIVGTCAVDSGRSAVCLWPPTDGSQPEMDRARLTTPK
ncbi:hypothetical protein HPB50_005850 [Hyalomma asiaticum]|uniref:Uncharacterized protein n=1 Tax=Hyalomma asiaticum TaxID=266040 RepID=A0ACB7S7W0_HYAAI|nr:hypothetical protein HPB50_005850 [Hyalomma asiaticum]